VSEEADVKTKTIDIAKSEKTVKKNAGFQKVIPFDGSGPVTTSGGSAFGQWKPTIYWYTPILMLLAAGALVYVLTKIIRRMGRASERRNWSDESRRQAYADRPFRSGPPESQSSPETQV
jgi:hypothetical protein